VHEPTLHAITPDCTDPAHVVALLLSGDLVQLLGIFDEGSAGVLHVTQPLEILDEVGKASIAVRQVVYHLGNTTAEALTVAALSGASYAIRSISFIISYCGRTSDISAAVGDGCSGTCLHPASSLNRTTSLLVTWRTTSCM
jgi:hypothetical protein